MEIKQDAVGFLTDGNKGENGKIAIILYFSFKILSLIISGISIYLGYKLFVLGVTGEASLVIDATDIQGQLLNAAPGLFFGVGGIVALVFIVIKGVNLKI